MILSVSAYPHCVLCDRDEKSDVLFKDRILKFGHNTRHFSGEAH